MCMVVKIAKKNTKVELHASDFLSIDSPPLQLQWKQNFQMLDTLARS